MGQCRLRVGALEEMLAQKEIQLQEVQEQRSISRAERDALSVELQRLRSQHSNDLKDTREQAHAAMVRMEELVCLVTCGSSRSVVVRMKGGGTERAEKDRFSLGSRSANPKGENHHRLTVSVVNKLNIIIYSRELKLNLNIRSHLRHRQLKEQEEKMKDESTRREEELHEALDKVL